MGTLDDTMRALLAIGIAVYFAMRPIPLPPGKDANATTPRSSAIVTELEALQSRYATGELSNDDYLSRKRSLFGLT